MPWARAQSSTSSSAAASRAAIARSAAATESRLVNRLVDDRATSRLAPAASSRAKCSGTAHSGQTAIQCGIDACHAPGLTGSCCQWMPAAALVAAVGAAWREKANTGETALAAVVPLMPLMPADSSSSDAWSWDDWCREGWSRASTNCPTKLVAPRTPAASAAPLFRAVWGSRCIANGRTIVQRKAGAGDREREDQDASGRFETTIGMPT